MYEHIFQGQQHRPSIGTQTLARIGQWQHLDDRACFGPLGAPRAFVLVEICAPDLQQASDKFSKAPIMTIDEHIF